MPVIYKKMVSHPATHGKSRESKSTLVWGLLAGLLFIPSLLFPVLAASVDGIRIRPSPERTRIVFDVSEPVEHRIFQLKNPNRLVIDISGAEFNATKDDLSFEKTPITNLRYARWGENDLRIVLELKEKVEPKSFILKPILQYGDRLVVDLSTEERQYQPVQQTDILSRQMRDLVIAIDAGHGGDDPGAVGHGKLYEKNVVLGIAQKMNARLDKESGLRGFMVRSGDYYIEHRKRTRLARDNRADVFVSIHADAWSDAQPRGASIYVLSEKGATSETARILAESENRSDLIGGVGSISLEDKDEILVNVLLDLSMTHTLSSSLDIGESVIRSLQSITPMHTTRVEQAAFAVLKAPDIPSILVETGFISNPKDAAALKTKSHQEKLAKAIVAGIRNYLELNPPEGTYLAWKRNESSGELLTYVIERGDTLTGIADRYRVSAEELKKVNGLNNDKIRIGQILKIPGS